MTPARRPFAARVRSWPGWAAMGIAVVVLLAVGTAREGGPRTQAERIDAIARKVACPTCDGESVFASRASAAEAIRTRIARDVAAGELSDDEIIARIAESFRAQVLLVPRSTGVDSLMWVLPVVVGVCSAAALAVAFRRWRGERSPPTEEDRALVARLLAGGPRADGTGDEGA